MTTSVEVRNRRTRFGLMGLVLLIVMGLLSFGYYRFEAWRDRTDAHSVTQARRLAEAVTVTGFVRTSVADMTYNYNGLSFADAYFIGPAPQPDPVSAVVVPTIDLKAVSPPIVAPEIGNAVVARGTRSDECAASVSFRKPSVSDPGMPTWNLTREQLDDVRAGRQIFVVVHVYNCAR